MFDLLAVSERPFSIVLTKIDKCSKSHVRLQEKSILSIMNNYPTTFKKIFLTTIKNNEMNDILIILNFEKYNTLVQQNLFFDFL